MRNKIYIEVNSAKESRLTQEYLFAMGYRWSSKSNEVPKVEHIDRPFLVINTKRKWIRFTVGSKNEIKRKTRIKNHKYTRGFAYVSPLWKVLNG